MQLLPLLLCVVFVSIAHAKLYAKSPKLRLNYIQVHNSQNYKYQPLLPQERRKLPLFPKDPMRYTISLKPMVNIPKPYLEKQKPFMKKFEEIIAESEIIRSKHDNILDKVDTAQTPTVKLDVIKEVSIEIVEDEPREPEFQNDVSKEQNKRSDITKSEAPIDDSDKEIIVQLKDIILPPRTELEVMAENKSGVVLPEEGNLIGEVDIVQTPIVDVDVFKEVSIEIVEDEPEEPEFQNSASEEQGELSDKSESEAPIDNSDNDIIGQLEDVILPPHTELEALVENKSVEECSSQNEAADGKDNLSNEGSEFQKYASKEQVELNDMIGLETLIDNSDKEIQLTDIILPPKTGHGENTKIDVVLPTVEETNKSAADDPNEKDNVGNDEIIQKIDNSNKDNTVQLADIIYPSKIELDPSAENKNGEVLKKGVEEKRKSDRENKVDDIIGKNNVSNEESIQNTGISDKENTVQLADILLPPNKDQKVNDDNKNGEVLLDVEQINKNSNENEADNVTDTAIEEENASNEETEDFVTTEIYMDPVIYRKKSTLR
ncbi:unnamed protein product [Spodoptera littoralis]|uniref:Uncharacterized protein n=1 Tax=Spodoptera littoralis TaxID=7109 RepID=A0A9P0HUN1_SPOLI|nr:unnamed protein product [Spodoptera littoralis]CAH1634809.1 unnamed protein product [Spodoptera littoralis]